MNANYQKKFYSPTDFSDFTDSGLRPRPASEYVEGLRQKADEAIRSYKQGKKDFTDLVETLTEGKSEEDRLATNAALTMVQRVTPGLLKMADDADVEAMAEEADKMSRQSSIHLGYGVSVSPKHKNLDAVKNFENKGSNPIIVPASEYKIISQAVLDKNASYDAKGKPFIPWGAVATSNVKYCYINGGGSNFRIISTFNIEDGLFKKLSKLIDDGNFADEKDIRWLLEHEGVRQADMQRHIVGLLGQSGLDGNNNKSVGAEGLDGRGTGQNNTLRPDRETRLADDLKKLDKDYRDALDKRDYATANDLVRAFAEEMHDNLVDFNALQDDGDVEGFKYHRGPAPTKTFKRYAVFNVKDGGFHAAYAGNKVATPVGVWLDAQNLKSYTSDLVQFQDGSFASYIPGDTGAPTNTKFSAEKAEEYGLSGGQRWLLERGGKHSSDVPNFSQMNLKQNENGEKVTSAKDGALPHNKLIFEIEYGTSENGDLTEYVKEHGRKDSAGKNQGLAKINPNEYYDFKTNPNAVGNWGIGGTFRIVRLVPHSEIGPWSNLLTRNLEFIETFF